jgi:hypothetical protein
MPYSGISIKLGGIKRKFYHGTSVGAGSPNTNCVHSTTEAPTVTPKLVPSWVQSFTPKILLMQCLFLWMGKAMQSQQSRLVMEVIIGRG